MKANVTIFVALVTALMLALTYHFFVVSKLVPPGIGETAWKVCLSRAEDYSFGDEQHDIVVAGSSLIHHVLREPG